MSKTNPLIRTLKETADALQNQLEEKDKRIRMLENEEAPGADLELDGEIIDCGIGTIRYETEGSIDLDSLMESIAEVIKEHGATALLRHLEETYGV